MIRDWIKEYSPNVLQILPEAKLPCALTGSDSADKESLNSDSVQSQVRGEIVLVIQLMTSLPLFEQRPWPQKGPGEP